MRSRISVCNITFAVIACMLASSCIAAGGNISLGELYPKEKLDDILIPRAQWRPFAKAKDRTAWTSIAESIQDKFIGLGQEYLGKDVPNLPATLYLEYRRVGNRSNYQDVWLERRKMLHCLVLAECIEGKGRFLDAVANVIWAICEESSWTFPAHIGAQKAGSGLPDVTEPIVALFSAETASSLAWTVYLLKEQLDTVSPQICKRAEREIDQRILTPYLERDNFGWMAFHARSDGRRPNNWNPWINSNVLAAILLIEKDESRRLELTHKVLRCLDNFFVPYPSDGSCDEGPSYWGRAGASLFDNLELLYSATDRRLDLYEESAIREIGRFIYRTHISVDYFANIGDCDARLDIDRDLVFRYGKRIGDKKMQDFATFALVEQGLFESERSFRSLGRMLHELFNIPDLIAARSSSQPFLRDVWLGHEDMQLMAARDKDGSAEGLYVACWASHNGQSHNHNDVGNFIIFTDGRPFIIDIGRPTYTRQTFSSRRYEIPEMQSAFHNLPTINGVMQQAGRRYGARDVRYDVKESGARLRMDIAPAYPDKAGVETWVRTVSLNRGKDIQVVDSFALKQASSDIAQSLITPCEVVRNEPGRLVLRDSREGIELAVAYDRGILTARVESIPPTDEKLVGIWGPRMYRILLKPKSPTRTATRTLRFSK
ncbi:MAG: heparinase II/III family protein [Phycisphaerales bacterium]|nr:MAG: heparinase II/III family protein [Phycisphaerales bacterium]